MSGRIVGAQPPSPGPKCEIVRHTSTEPTTYFCVGSAIFGQWIHWYGNRSHECTHGKKECNGCLRGWPRKWKGYLHCISGVPQKECFVELTPTAAEMLHQMAPSGSPLRGVIMRMSKSRGGAKGRYSVEVLERRSEEDKLPKEKDPYPILAYLWACKNQSTQKQEPPL